MSESVRVFQAMEVSMNRSALRMVGGLGLILGLGVTAAPPAAEACGFAVERAVDQGAINISKAEKAVGDEHYLAAALSVVRAFPNIKSMTPDSGALQARALRVLAVSAVRLDGALTVGNAMKGNTEAERKKNIEFSIKTLRALNDKKKNDPGLQTDLGEALAKTSSTEAEGLKILQGLADKDLIASAQGYATLAKLKSAAGDTAARDAAIKKCEAMTKVVGVCKVPSPPKNA